MIRGRRPGPARPRAARPAGLAIALACLTVAAVLLAACGGAAPLAHATGPLATAPATASPAVQAAFGQLDTAFRAGGLVLEATRTAIRPAEPPSFAGVPRWPFHAVLPDDPAGGYGVIYEFADVALAADGGREMAAYITSGPGRVQYPPDVRFVLRQAGSTLVFYPWSPASSPDPKTPDVAAAIATVGSEVPIPGG